MKCEISYYIADTTLHRQELVPSLGDLIASGHARVPAASR
jgi:hypothetical protein